MMNTIETFRRQPKNALRDAYEWLRISYELFDECPVKSKEMLAKRDEHIRKQKVEIRELIRKTSKPELKPLYEEKRHLQDDWDSGYDYAILPDMMDKTDEEIETFISECVEIPFRYEAWDCTGKPLTAYVHWNRTPVGVVIVHRWNLDV